MDMQDILIGALFLVAFGGLMVFIYRIIGEDANKVHGCCAGGMVIEEDKKTEVA
jgi:hypothetical protein